MKEIVLGVIYFAGLLGAFYLLLFRNRKDEV